MRYFVELAFDGTPFCGWQIQHNAITVQEVMEHAFSLLLNEQIAITGCGRTDAGVHARQFFAHFDSEKEMTSDDCLQLKQKLNSFLPTTIAVYNIFRVEDEKHARFDATSRTYRYYVIDHKDPFFLSSSLPIYRPLEVDLMNDAALLLLKTEDFTSFSKLHTQVNNNLCHVTSAQWMRRENCLVFEITANRFLRNMVRAIVGTLLDVGEGKCSLEEFQTIIDQKDREKAGRSVPANALFLERIEYPSVNSLR